MGDIRWAIVDWDDDGEGVEPRHCVPASVVEEHRATAAKEGQEIADSNLTDWLSDDSGWCVNGWCWEN